MKLAPFKVILPLLALTAGGFLKTSVAHAFGNEPAPAAGEKYYWYDGDTRREVWLDSSLVADFDDDSEDEAVVRKVDPQAQTLPKTASGARFWKVGEGKNSRTVAREASGLAQGKSVSPVFRSSAQGGRQMALPGGVIVIFKSDWDEARIQQWATDSGFVILKKLPVGSTTYLIQTGPGLDSLETANQIFESGDVVAATPDWWKEHSLR